MPRRTIAVVGALVLLLLPTTATPVRAQGAIADPPAVFERPVSSFDAAPLANFLGVSEDPMVDHVFEMGWWYRIAGDVAEKFLPVPTSQTYLGDTATIVWTDVDERGFRADETDVVQAGLSPLGGPAGQVVFSLTLTNPSADTPLAIDVFHVMDVDLAGTSGSDEATLLEANTRIRIVDGPAEAPNATAEYAALDADAYLVLPYDGTGQADVAGRLSDADLDDFDNTGLPFAAGDVSSGFQWFTRVIPPLGSATFVAGIAVNQALVFPGTATTTSTTTSTMVDPTTVTTSSSTTSSTLRPERCDNCADDDGDGLVDFEDGDCCTPAPLTLQKSVLRPAGPSVAKVKLKARLSESGLVDGPKPTQDVVVQLRGTEELLCARVPASSLERKRTRITFRDGKGTTASARGLDAVALVERRRGGARLTVTGRRAALAVPPAGTLAVTFGLRDPSTAEATNRCASSVVPFRSTRRGLRYP